MSYIDNHLMQGETIVFRTKLNWTEYIKGIIVLIVGFILRGNTFGVILIFIGIVMEVSAYIKITSSEFAVTDRRVLIKVGVITTQSLETMISKIEGIHVEQGILGKLANSGSIIVKGTGGTNNPFTNINKPYEFRNAVNSQISKPNY